MARLLWTQKQHVGPQARVGHALAYDSERRRTVLFGDPNAGDFGGVQGTLTFTATLGDQTSTATVAIT